ncbi:ABC transporter substrate-binding protein [Nocardioides bruguierae]|uniref:Extracellular solute-binding protein n=1 Tax=Nocardioides bruguierae TaxID=2945102 RepID=A0A9X2D7Y2_9ACTN|nr:extracellular solute-binding protein [Nocardioides bruguierae]MCM0620943.1 extracellular solute-binding protein [Nocardioides bruguierae]
MNTWGTRRRRRSTIVGVGLAVASLTTLAACGGSSDSASGEGDPEAFSFLINSENTNIPPVLESLAADQCSAENDALPLEIETIPQTQLDQQLQLLAGQDALPVSFAAGNTPELVKTLDEAGQLLDFDETLTDLGVIDDISPAAISTIETLYGGFNVLPYQYNIEGFWYNTELFDELGIAVPTTWDEMVDAAEQLDAAGVQPFSASGEQGWPLTRLVSGYLFRELGPDALQAVADGDAALTDPEYVGGAQAVADLGEQGWFGQGLGSIDYDTAVNTFMSGDAGMLYMGSWVLSNFSDEDLNKIGNDSIGYFPFPDVEGGAGSAEQTPANVGLPMTFSAKQYNSEVGDWLTCISENWGAAALEVQDMVSGFTVNSDVELDPLTREVSDQVAAADSSVLWFEALFGAQATNVGQTNAASFVSGNTSAEDFMSTVQSALDSE